MKQLYVGHYMLGSIWVDVYLREGTGGEFYYAPEPARTPRIKIGIDGTWNEIVGVAVHEAAEYVLSNIRCRYELDDISGSSDRFHFFANHYQFSTMTLDVGSFLANCLPDLSRAYKDFKKKAR